MKNTIIIVTILFALSFSLKTNAQTDSINVKNLSRSEIVKLDYNQLLALPFEDLMFIANKTEQIYFHSNTFYKTFIE